MPTTGSGQFPYPNSSAVPDVPADVLLLAQRVDKMASGWTVCADATARAALVTNGDAYEGLHVYQIDTKLVYVYQSTAWVLESPAAYIGRAVRSSGTPTVSSAAFSDLSTTANWSTTSTAGKVKGFAAYSDGWTIPASGVYQVSYSITSTANIALAVGVTVNKGSGVGTTDLKIPTTALAVQSVVAASASGQMYLAVNDVVRLYALAASGTPALTASMGHFAVTWVAAQ